MIQEEDRNKLVTIGMAAILLLNIFVNSPCTVFLTNIEQFSISLTDVIKLCVIPALVILLIFVAVIKLIPDKIILQIATLIATTSILVWFQGNILLWDYGILNGKIIKWDDYLWRGWIDSLIWLTAIFLVFRFRTQAGIYILKTAVFIFILQLLTLGYAAATNWKLIQKESQEQSIKNLKELFRFSTGKNILHIITDGFQSDVFNELLNQDSLKGTYRQAFAGFTYYRETLGIFPYTRFAVPALLSEKIYSNNLPKDEFVDTTLSGHTIIATASKEGFEIDIGSGGNYFTHKYSNLPHTNLYNLSNAGSVNIEFKDAAMAFDLGIFRILPHVLKKYVYNDQKWLISRLFVNNKLFQFRYFAHTYFLNLLSRLMTVDREKPVYKFFHVMNTHDPMVVDKDCMPAERPTRMNRDTLTIQSRCTLDTLVKVFNRMKELGIYDNTLIIIHGDHGGWVPNYRQGPTVRFSNGDIAPEWLTSLASPFLAIKHPGDKNEFRISDAEASLLDIPATISDIMDWEDHYDNQSLDEIKVNAPRKRIFRFYFWQRDAWETDHTGPIHEFTIEGSHYDHEWKPGHVFYPPE